MKKKLTLKEEKFWEAFQNYYFTHLQEPTRDEMANYIKVSPQLVQYYYDILKKKRWLKLSKTIKVGIKPEEIKK